MIDYRDAIKLDEPWTSEPDPDWRRSIVGVLRSVGEFPPGDVAPDAALHLLRGRLAEVDPYELPATVMDQIESIYAAVADEQGIRKPRSSPGLQDSPWFADRPDIGSKLAVVVGDITTFDVDAIVNAANSQMLGCRIPNHRCIDNAIHSASGPRLRDDCATVMAAQSHPEPVGQAKITRGYALPSRYVIHTVGPQLAPGAAPTPEETEALASCYRSCLDAAASVESVRSVAVCGISTGVFAYPKPEAASVALTTMADWLEANTDSLDRVIINCFSSEDADHYHRLLASPPARNGVR